MSAQDGISMAAKKNRARKFQLASELHRINKEQENEIRMHNNCWKRLKKNLKIDPLPNNNDSSGVRMYETHNPGFCFRRNGECRVPQSSSFTPSLDFQDIQNLLFTDGEVDIEKVLCLHLLSTHRTETLTSPKKFKHIYYFREQSPVERLIERSKRRQPKYQLQKILPTYVLDVSSDADVSAADKENVKNKNKNFVISDGRLLGRLLVNDKILQLIDSVLAALQQSNPEKMEEMITVAGDPKALQELLQKPKIQKFSYILRGQPIITSCESFHLTLPFRRRSIILEIKTECGHLENLVKQIRKEVLQYPKPYEKPNMTQYDGESTITGKESISETSSRSGYSFKTSFTSLGSSRDNSINSRRRSNSFSSDATKDSSRRSSYKSAYSEPSRHTPTVIEEQREPPKEESEDDKRFREEFLNFKQQERELLQQEFGIDDFLSDEEKRVEEQKEIDEEFKKMEKLRKSNLSLNELATMLSDKIKAAHRRDVRLLYTHKTNNEDEEEEEDEEECNCPAPLTEDNKNTQVKISLKKTTCEACMHKWKIPLPSPKPSRLKKKCLPVLDGDNYKRVKTKSTHRLSLLIEELFEKVAMENQKRANNKNKVTARDLKNALKSSSFLSQGQHENIVLTEIDLAKIRQEIKEIETQKKLRNFLNNPV